ncbi:MAG: flagellar biosynthetic protein FliR [bacterium]|jgi:flagellar biosynthetic protein FliR
MKILPQPYEAWFMTFFFVYLRISVAVFTLPVISNEAILPAVRAGLAFWIAVILVGPLWGLHEVETGYLIPISTQEYAGIVDFMIAISAEVLMGFFLGFLGQILVQSIALAGEIIGQQAGFSAASIFDPITGQDVFLMEQILTMFGTMIFLIIGGPEIALQIVADSFRVVGPGEGFALAAYADASIYTMIFDDDRRFALINMLYRAGVQIAAPIMVAMILVSVAEAFIARIVPQLNILAVGFAVRISISLVILAGMIPFIYDFYSNYLMQYVMYANAFLQRLTTG